MKSANSLYYELFFLSSMFLKIKLSKSNKTLYLLKPKVVVWKISINIVHIYCYPPHTTPIHRCFRYPQYPHYILCSISLSLPIWRTLYNVLQYGGRYMRLPGNCKLAIIQFGINGIRTTHPSAFATSPMRIGETIKRCRAEGAEPDDGCRCHGCAGHHQRKG